MDIGKVVAIAIVGVIIVGLLKQQRAEFSTYVSIIVGVIILYMIIDEIKPVVSMISNLSSNMGVSNKFFVILLKITGVAYLSEFGANVCRDSGETAIAVKVELAGKILIIGLSIPILTTLIETLLGLI